MATPGGSPPGSPPLGPQVDGNEIAMRIMQAAEAAANAATSTANAVELFRQQAEGNSTGAKASTDWFKLLPKPNSFEPKDYDQEVAGWRDWWWTVNQYLCTLDTKYETELAEIEAKPSVMQDHRVMGEEEKKRSMFLYGLLASLLRGRLLTVLRGIPDNNGYEALRQLVLQCQPTSRNRSLGILHALMSWQSFDMKNSLLSQVVRLEDAFREYDKISAQPMDKEMKFAILLRCITGQLRTHLNINMKDDATYDFLRESILQYDRASIKWSETMALGNRSNANPGDESTPMEIDLVNKGKGKHKGKKGKGKGKDGKGGKGKPQRSDGGKSKGKDKGKGKSGNGKGYNNFNNKGGQGKGKAPLPPDMCKLCGGYGHWSRECPVRTLRQVSQSQDGSSTVATQSMVSSTPGTGTQPSGSPTAVRRIIQVNLDELEEDEPKIDYKIRMVKTGKAYDLTYSDSDDDWWVCGQRDGGDNAYFVDSIDLTVDKHCKDEGPGSSPVPVEGGVIRGVTCEKGIAVILDSGADMSVLPLKFKDVGEKLTQKSVLRDAQGNRMAGGNMRQAMVELTDEAGNKVCLRETFALSNVAEPLLALGKIVRRGWRVEGRDGEIHLSCGIFDKVLTMRNNSLVTDAEIRMVSTEEKSPTAIRTVTMTFERHMADVMEIPGWHLTRDRKVPFLVTCNSQSTKDCAPQFNRVDLPFRTTIVKKGAEWEVVEFADREREEKVILECNGNDTTVVCFFHQEMEDVNFAGTVHTGEDDPFLQRQREEGPQREQQGFGWEGQTLEDGVYEDDENEEMGEQPQAEAGGALQRQPPELEEVADEEVEIEIEGKKYSARSSLRDLREGLKICGLPKGRSKAQAWERLLKHHQHFAENLGVELAQREFERRKIAEGGDGVRPQSIPRLPTKIERQIHELTHWPYEDWCMHCVAARGKADPHRRQGEDEMKLQAKSEYPVVSMDFCFTRGLTEPTEVDKEDIRLYGGDVRGGVALVVTDDWTRGVLALPTPGKGRSQAKYLAEQVVRYIGACGFSTCIVKADAEPSTKLLLDIIAKARQRLGFKTIVELSGPDDSQGNGRVEREIQTVRGLARTLIRAVREGAKVEVDVYGPLAQWALRHAAWLLTHFRRQAGSPTAYEMVTGRRYIGKLANFGERVLARIPAPNGVDKFQTAIWVGKSDRADFHMVFTNDGLRWTRAIRRMPEPYDAEFLACVRSWPWSISHGQIGVKQSALLAKVPSTPLPPHLAPAIRAEEAAARRGILPALPEGQQVVEALEDGDQRQAGPVNEEAASDPTSRASGSGSTSSSSSSAPQQMDDDMVLDELVKSLQEDNDYEGGTDQPPKRDGGELPEADQPPSKAMKPTFTRKAPRIYEPGSSSSSSQQPPQQGPQPDGESQVRVVVAGEVLEDGDMDLQFPDQPPDLSPDELFEVEAQSIKKELTRLVEMGVLQNADGVDLADVETLSTRFVMDWRWREDEWQRRARLVARDYAWVDPNRTDTFAPAGGQSLLRVIPAIAQLRGWGLATLDVKDAYLMCPQRKKVKVTVDRAVAESLQIPRDWVLGRVLPGQREGASEWFQHLKGTLVDCGLKQCPEAPTMWGNDDHTIALLIHVDDMVLTGTDAAMNELIEKLEKKYKVSIERGDQVNFLKRMISREGGETKIRVNDKYLDGLVTLFEGVKKKRSLGEVIIDDEPIMDEGEVTRYRSGVGTLLYISGDRPDIQFHTKELASKLSSPTKGSMATLVNVIGYLVHTKDVHLVMDGDDPSRSFRDRAYGLSTGPIYENNKQCWLLEVATDSDWSGNKSSRSSTSCGCIFLGGNWIYSYSRTQRNITLSSTESEYVALVSGASEGLLLRAVLAHLVGPAVEMKLYADNTSAVAIANKEGVGRIKHLDGKLLWVQQRQGRDFQLRRLDTATNPSDLGTKSLGGKRVRLLLYLMHYENELGSLGEEEFLEERQKKEKRDQLKSIRTVIHHEVEGCGERPNSSLMNNVAKKLMRLTLAALLTDAGEALGLPDEKCVAMAQPMRSSMTSIGMVYFLLFVIGVLVVLLVVMCVKANYFRRSALYHINMVRQVRKILKEDIARRRAIRNGEIPEACEASESEEIFEEDYEEETPYMIRRVIHDHGAGGPNDDPPARDEADGQAMDSPMNGEEAEEEEFHSFDYDIAEDENLNPENESHEEEGGEPEDNMSLNTSYGSLGIIADEEEHEYAELNKEDYEEWRFQCLSDERGIESYLLHRLAQLREMPMERNVWEEIRGLMKLQKDIQLGGPKIRLRAIQFLYDRQRFQHLINVGSVYASEPLCECEHPDEWIAWHYGWPGSYENEDDREASEEDDSAPTEAGGSLVVNSVAADLISSAAASSSAPPVPTTAPAPTPTTTTGEGMQPLRDPPVDDEAQTWRWFTWIQRKWLESCVKGRVKDMDRVCSPSMYHTCWGMTSALKASVAQA